MAYMESIDGSVADFQMPVEHVSGDELFAALPKKSADIEHQRNGVTISLRKWKIIRTWRVVYTSLTKSEVESFRDFFELRIFKIHPTWITSYYFIVKWSGDGFNPTYNSTDSYGLTFTLEEVQT